MLKGTITHYAERDGERTVHAIPQNGTFDVYYEKDGFPMMHAFGVIASQPDGTVYDLEDAFRFGWDNFPDYEEEMFF